ncbi:MAG: GH3 auxin-responsive promoter family protein [Candidatus Thorarchaeota archaeon]
MSIMSKLVSVIAKRKAKEIDHVLNNPVEESNKYLSTLLNKHQDTVIGRRYGFEAITSPEKYSERVPLSDFNSMQPILEEVYNNPAGMITTSEPVIWYLTTSGTTGNQKQMPLTKSGLKAASTGGSRMWMGYMNQNPDNVKILEGAMIMFGAPSVTGEINGVPTGYGSGVYVRNQNKMFSRLIKPSEDVFRIQDMEEKMKAYALCTATNDVTALQGLATLNLAFVRRMEEQYGPWLMEQLKGTKHEKKLRNAIDSDGKLDVAELWPNLRLFVSGGIDVDPYRKWINSAFPNVTVWEGYAASEGYIGSQILPEYGLQLMPDLNYFEFIPEKESMSENPIAIPLSDVKKGNRYELVMSNHNGWYRYRLGDMVTFTRTDPYTVRHISRKGGTISLAGEKLSDAHVIKAMAEACVSTGAEIMDYSVVGVADGDIPYYAIAAMFHDDVDSVDFVVAFENAIGEVNWEFTNSRGMGALGPTILRKMKSSQHEEVVKETHLQAKPMPLTTDRSVFAVCEAT